MRSSGQQRLTTYSAAEQSCFLGNKGRERSFYDKVKDLLPMYFYSGASDVLSDTCLT